MRILFFGYQGWGYESLKALINTDENIVAVITHKKNPAEETWYGDVKTLAEENKIKTYVFANIGPEEISIIESLKPELILSIGYRKIIQKRILQIPRHGAINLHGSLLPKYRGGAVLNWALINDEEKTGVTAHIMEEKFDTGDIVCQKEIPIYMVDDVLDVYSRALPLYPAIALEVVQKIKEGHLERMPQDPTKATYTKQRKPDDGLIDWKKSSRDLYNWIRALTYPYPGAFSFFRGRKVFLWKSEIDGKNYHGQTGEVVEITEHYFVIKSKDKGIRILKAQFEGKEKMNGKEFCKKYELKKGEIFQ